MPGGIYSQLLVSLVTEDGKCDAEIKTRIGMTKLNFGKMRDLLTNLNLNIRQRERRVRCYIWSGMLYGCESWTISAVMKKRLEATEMWLSGRMMRVRWTARLFNQQVLQMSGTSRLMMTKIRQMQLRHVGHVLRSRSLAKDCLLGTIEGTRAGGRQRMKLMDAETSEKSCVRQKIEQGGATL